MVLPIPEGETTVHLETKFATSGLPHPVALSYPVVALYPIEPPEGQSCVPAMHELLLFPDVVS